MRPYNKNVLWVWLAVSALVITPDLHYYVGDGNYLGREAVAIAGEEADPHEIVRKIGDAARGRITSLDKGRFYDLRNRPVLRHRARETWEYAEGYCGEGARVMINMLDALGVRAARIILYMTTGGQHIAIAYFHNGEWFLADSINSPAGFNAWLGTEPRPLGNLVGFEDRNGTMVPVVMNPVFERYSFFNWSRVFGSSLEVYQTRPFPRIMTLMIENPPLVRIAVKLGLLSLLAFVFLLSGRLLQRRH